MSSRLEVKRQSKTVFTACVALTRLSCALAHALLSIGNHPLARGGGVFPLSNFYNGSLSMRIAWGHQLSGIFSEEFKFRDAQGPPPRSV
jgi:hypothetical protein